MSITNALQIGIVAQSGDDPEGEHRVLVKLSMLDADSPAVWARLLHGVGSNSFDALDLPEIGDEVVLSILNNDSAQPVILGRLYSSKHAPPDKLAGTDAITSLLTRNGTRIDIDDTDQTVTISTPARHRIVISDEYEGISVSDENGNKMTTNSKGIEFYSNRDILINAGGKINISAGTDISVNSPYGSLEQSALNITASASSSFVAKGEASVEISASGLTTVKGATVKIN